MKVLWQVISFSESFMIVDYGAVAKPVGAPTEHRLGMVCLLGPEAAISGDIVCGRRWRRSPRGEMAPSSAFASRVEIEGTGGLCFSRVSLPLHRVKLGTPYDSCPSLQ